ncbi:MAG TPA: hypothetical protein VGH20_01470 [Myxococcales bacterium]|jgi:hypothetical protein
MSQITSKRSPVKLFVAVNPDVAAIAERIAPALSQIFAEGEEPATVREVVEAMILRGAIAMEQEYLGTSSMNPNSVDDAAPAPPTDKSGLFALARNLMSRARGLGLAA